MTKLQLRIIIRPSFPKKHDILLEGVVDTEEITVDVLAKLAFDIETTLNEYLPQIRVHSNVEIKNGDDKQ